MPPAAPAALPEETTRAEDAVHKLLAGYGLNARAALKVLQSVGERCAQDAGADEEAAFRLVRLRSARAEVALLSEEGGCLGDAEFARRLGLRSRQSVHNYREEGKLFALPKGVRNHAYPAWLIHKGSLLPGLAETLALLDAKGTSAVGKALFFLTPAEALEDRRPLDLLRRGETADVLAHAERYGEIGS